MSFERANISRMRGYRPGEQPLDADTVKLNANENPYPPSPAVVRALAETDGAALRRYPPPLADDFRRAAAALHGVAPENIIATNGGDELLRLAFATFVEPGGTAAATRPGYSLLPALAAVQDARLLEIPLEDDWSMPADFAARLGGVRLCLLANPHAPTGMLLDAGYLAGIARSLDGVLLIDEAYADFVDPRTGYDAAPLIARHDNVLILRTLSKGHSLAGLRFGYGMAAEPLIGPMLLKTRDSYNTSTVAQRLAAAALGSVEHARAGWERIRRERARLAGGLERLGFDVAPSQANFLLAAAPSGADAGELCRRLRARNVLVRHFDEPRLDDKLRITVGDARGNAALLAALGALLGDGG